MTQSISITGPDGRPIDEHVAEALDKSRVQQANGLHDAAEKIRKAIIEAVALRRVPSHDPRLPRSR